MLRMKKVYLILFFLFVLVAPSFAAVDLPWFTTFDCPEWNNQDNLNCDGMNKYLRVTSTEGHSEQITSRANNPNGGGGKGQRHWYSDGTNAGSGGIRVIFKAPPNEIWIRWYMKFPLGFKWSRITPNYDKLILIFTDKDFIRLRLAGNEIGATGYLNPTSVSSTGNKGWLNINGGPTGDGQWHCYESHLKIDGSNGKFDIWIDGELVLKQRNVAFTGATQFEQIVFGSNQSSPDNGRDLAIDFDDIAISASGYIGPIVAPFTPSSFLPAIFSLLGSESQK